jgi:recombination DNA repair RAD52 pathway protein
MSQAYRFAKEEVQRQEELQNPTEVLKKKAKRKRDPYVSEPDPKERKYIENYVKTKHPTLFPDVQPASVAPKVKKKRACKVTRQRGLTPTAATTTTTKIANKR